MTNGGFAELRREANAPKAVRRRGLALAFIALLMLFLLYLGIVAFLSELADKIFMPRIVAIFAKLNETIAGGDAGAEITALTIWTASALAAIVTAVGAIARSALVVYRFAPNRIGYPALAVFVLLSFAAIMLTITSPQVMVKFPHELCALASNPSNPSIFCSQLMDVKQVGWSKLSNLARLKMSLNFALESATLFTIGSMLLIAGVDFRDNRLRRWQSRRFDRHRPFDKVLSTAALVLVTITLTDVLYCAWPIAAFGLTSPQAQLLSKVLGGFTLYFAIAGSIILVVGFLLSALLQTSNRRRERTIGNAISRIRSMIAGSGVQRVLTMLAPIITAIFGNTILLQMMNP